MKILILLLLPLGCFAQSYYEPQPEIKILRVETKKDTLFVFREINAPPHSMSVNREWVLYRDREVYVIKNKEIILLRTERPKIRKKQVETEEEYW